MSGRSSKRCRYQCDIMKETKEGRRFAIASFLIAVAALNTGNNLIYLIFSLMLSLLVLSVLLLKVNLSGLSLAVGSGPVLFAGQEASLKLLLNNHKRLLPSYSVECLLPGALMPAYFVMAPPLRGVEKEVAVKFERRGVYSYGNFQSRSGFPFILLNGERSLKATGEVLVYPALRSVEGLLEGFRGNEGMDAFRLSNSGDDIFSLREFRNGDDRRRIHWKASAKTGDLLVREYADYEVTRVTVVLDNLLPAGGELFEKAVSLTASFAKEFLERGHSVRVVTCGRTIPFGSGDEHLFSILDILAVIKEEDDCGDLLQDTGDGYFVHILKSRLSLRSSYAGSASKVFYAEDL